MQNNIKLSIVITARNDNYGDNWINRINTFIKVLTDLTNEYKTCVELVFVEYNPVPDKKRLYEQLTIKNNFYFPVRFITVPAELHNLLPGHERTTVCEFIAKNIGIRRAKSDMILATNPDVIFTKDLFQYITSENLDTNTFYRVNRTDLSVSVFDQNLTMEGIYKVCNQKKTRILYNSGTVYISFWAWFHRFIHGRTWHDFILCPFLNQFRPQNNDDERIHENAAGDFLMMRRSLWEKARGYDEMTVQSGIMDGYILYVLHCYGAKQRILSYTIFHINHKHGKGPYIASREKFVKDAKEMLRTKVPYKINSPTWGFSETKFDEITTAPKA